MSLLQLIKDDALQARKDRDRLKSAVLILVIGECERIAKDATDDQVVVVGRKMIKNLDQVIATRTSLASSALEQKNILSVYFPPEEELTIIQAISKVVSQLTEEYDVGKVTGLVMKLTKGKYLVSEVKQAVTRFKETILD